MKLKNLLNKSKKSLKVRTGYILILILTLFTGISVFVNGIYVKSILEESVINEMNSSGFLIRRTVNMNLNYFQLDKFSGMGEFLSDILNSNEKLSYSFISDRSRIILYHNEKQLVGSNLNEKIYMKKYFSEQTYVFKKSGYIEVIIPIFQNRSIIGYIHLGSRESIINEKVISLSIITLIIFCFSLIASIGIIFVLISRKILNPIARLSYKMKKIAQQMQFDKELEIFGEDEIAELGKTFNIMLKEIKNYSENLEEIVHQRTLELNKANTELEEKNIKIDKEIKMAASLQTSILPKEFPILDNINFGSFYISMEQVGGDYYDIFPLGTDTYGIVIADVSGHGVPASLITMMAKVAFTTYSREGATSDMILEKVNKELVKVLGLDVMHYITAFYLIIDTKHNAIQYSSAGHPAQIVYSQNNNEIKFLKTYGRFLGIQDDSVFGRGEMLLEKDDRIILYTDGIIEARDSKDEQYKLERLLDFIKNNSYKNTQIFINDLIENLNHFTLKAQQSDDQALISIYITKNKERKNIVEKYKQREKELSSIINLADKAILENDYKKAISLLIQAMYKEGKNDNSIIIKIADCYKVLNDINSASKYLEYAVSLDPKNSKLREDFYKLCDSLRREF